MGWSHNEDCDVMDHIKRAIGGLADAESDPEGIRAKTSLYEHLTEDSDIKEILTVMAIHAALHIGKALRDLNVDLDDLEKADIEGKKDKIKQFAKDISLDDLRPTLDFSFLGVMLGKSLTETDSPEFSLRGPTNEVKSIIEGTLSAMAGRVKTGICETCGNLQRLRPIGSNGQEVCKKCYEKNPDTIIDNINRELNLSLTQRFGKDAPMALASRVSDPTKLAELGDMIPKTDIGRLIQVEVGGKVVDAKSSIKEDITRFN